MSSDFFKQHIRRGETMHESFQLAIDLLEERGAQVVVETGCMRMVTPLLSFLSDGGSTIIFGEWAVKRNAKLYSVDIDIRSVLCARMNTADWTQNVSIIHSDSVEFLQNFDQSIDFLYLDSYDYNGKNPKPAQEHCLNELLAAEDKLGENAVVMIDDCDPQDGGKGPLAIAHLLKNGWEILFSERQVILTKKGRTPK